MTNKALFFGFFLGFFAFWTIILISPYLRKKVANLITVFCFELRVIVSKYKLLLLVNLVTVDLNGTAASYAKTF